MVVVKVEMWPHGLENKKYELGVAHISNVGGDGDYGDYDVTLFKSATYAKPKNAGLVYKKGAVLHFKRHRGPWPLLMLAIQSALNEGVITKIKVPKKVKQ